MRTKDPGAPAAPKPQRRRVIAVHPAAAHAASEPCLTCHVRALCITRHLDDAAVTELDAVAIGRSRFHAGDRPFTEGDPFACAHAVRSGSFKTTVRHASGATQVSEFVLPGDVMGLDGAASGRHASSAIALEDSEVCALAFDGLRRLATGNPKWHDALCGVLGLAIATEHGHAVVLGDTSTEGRLAGFLLQMSAAMQRRGYSGTEFHLRMSRADIGSYLGLRLETVSRTLSALQLRGVLQVHHRHLRILSLDGLRSL